MIVEIYKIPIEFAFIIFPFVAFLFTLPFLIHEYYKFGAIPFLKSVLFYSLILYLLTAYFMVIMPLPAIEDVANYKGRTMQLIPFNFISDIQATANIHINDLSSLLSFLNKSTVYTVLFNILLTLPFGIYLRYLFNKKWYQTIIYTFFLSLFFELTQLSGLYGIYPRPYRLFDVDDLIINTIGGLIGYIITPLFVYLLPTKEELNKQGYIKGQKVSLFRRLVALFIDLIFLSIFSLLFRVILLNTDFYNYYFPLAVFLYYILLPSLNNTKTFGKILVKTEITGTKDKFSIFHLIIRNFIFSFVILFPFTWLTIIKDLIPIDMFYIIMAIVIFIEIVNIFVYFVPVYKQPLFLYEIISQTRNKSSISFEPKVDTINRLNKDDSKIDDDNKEIVDNN